MKPQRPQRETLWPQKDLKGTFLSKRTTGYLEKVGEEQSQLFNGKLQGKGEDEIQSGIYLSKLGKRMGVLFLLRGRLQEEVKRLRI